MHKVTVLMTTYNESKNLFEESLKSILQQTYKDFNVMVVVDNPKNTEVIELIKYYANKDSRIAFIVNDKNLGLAGALNKGIDMIQTEYIARMDADDIADIERLEKQVCYAKEHPEVDLFGTNVVYMDYNSNILYSRGRIPTDYKKIKKIMKYANVFNHPTFFGKTSVFQKYKYRLLKYSQDYDFICRLLENGCVITNMPEYLLNYRLPVKKSEEKLIRQRITYYCIQKNYKKGILNKVNIEDIIEKEMKEVNNNKVASSIFYYDQAFVMKKNNEKIKFIKLLLKSFITSKYQRKQILNLVSYYFINK